MIGAGGITTCSASDFMASPGDGGTGARGARRGGVGGSAGSSSGSGGGGSSAGSGGCALPGEAFRSDCIYCGSRTGSAEHIVPACLGGLRTDRGILCSDCNSRFSTIDASLGRDMRVLNALIGALHGRGREPIEAQIEDAATRRKLILSGGRQLRHAAAVVVDENNVDGLRTLSVVASTQAQVDDFLRRLKTEGKFRVIERSDAPALFATTPRAEWGFGGVDTFRCVAKIVLNVLAHLRPALARGEWLRAVKNFVVHGGDSDEWVRYCYPAEPEAWLPVDSFPFQHRFALVLDPGSRLAFARVSLLGVAEFAATLGTATCIPSEVLVYDVNVLASSAPDDVRIQILSDPRINPPTPPPADPSPFVASRLSSFIRKRDGKLWEDDAPRLVTAINATRQLPDADRHSRIVEALDGQQQRLLNLVSLVVRRLRADLLQEFGEAAGGVADAFDLFARPDPSSMAGVTELTRTHTELLREVMADHLLELLEKRAIEADDLKGFLEGNRGAAIVFQHVYEHVRRPPVVAALAAPGRTRRWLPQAAATAIVATGAVGAHPDRTRRSAPTFAVRRPSRDRARCPC